ncbi:hypothetical protein LDENG_00274150 [Lucifuga dentata]|nr:hypothetical protein LDENG_00274150 [Lucifuga dentata]
MDDAYPFVLLVKLEENNIPKLKNKLVKYFQSKKSNGGDCQVEYENGSVTAALRFRTQEDRQRVLEKAHELSLDKGVLKMTVCLPDDEESDQEAPPHKLNKTCNNDQRESQPSVKRRAEADEPTSSREIAIKKQVIAEIQTEAADCRGDESADEELCSTLAVLGNIPLSFNQEFLEMMVENILKDSESPNASRNISLELIPSVNSAVVTFQSGKENTYFLARCPNNRMFKNKGLSVRPLEATAQVRIEDIQNASEDLLALYFENEGEEVENVVVNEEEQSAIITFKNPKAVHRITKKQHHIKQKVIKIYPFYKSLGTALYGKDKPALKLPAAVSESIDSAISQYLNVNPKATETIRSELAKHFCKFDLQQSTVRLSPLPSLLQQKNKDIKEWKDTVTTVFAQARTKFKSLKFQAESDAWEECEGAIREVLQNEDVVVVPDKASSILSVVGLVDDVSRLEQSLHDVINKITKRVQREKLSVTQEISVSPSLFHILCKDGLQDKVLVEYPEVKMSYRNESQELIVNGLNHEVFGVNKVVLNGVMALKRRNLEIDPFVLEFLKTEQQDEITSALLTSSKINAALEISAERVQLLAVSDNELNDAEAHLKRLLISEYVDVEDSNVLKKPEWQYLVIHLQNSNNASSKKIQIQTKGQQVVVSGYKDSIKKVSSELDHFLQQNAQIEETIEVKPNTIAKYIEKNNGSWLEHMKDKVVVSFGNEAINLSGSRANVTDCKAFFEDLVSSVFFEHLSISKPGVKKFFQDKESMYVSSIMTETGCLVQLVDENGDRQGDVSSVQGPKPLYQLQTSDGVEIAVFKGDMCTFPVHAVVNSAAWDLKLNGGLSKVLLDAAGPQLQDECDRVMKVEGKLKPGDCVMTGAGGRLLCKKIIHAVAPSYDAANPQKAVAQLKRTIKRSLELAEKYSCVSVALPAISRNLGFPLALCANTIIKAVKEHCDDNTLKRIHLVNNDDSAVQAMEAAVKQEFGKHGVSHFQQSLPTQSPPPVNPGGHVASDPNILNQVLTKEGLDITLMKGYIEKATTDVTVNTVTEDLVLTKGVVSKAIFNAAGQKLQQLVNDKQTSGKFGDVIVTDGCGLKSKHVFHAVVPHWDNGKGAAEKILSGIFKVCLGQAEDSHMTSITFPAIGTGNLGFPKDLAASLLLDEILKFSSKKKPKHLKKVVIILYPTDVQTIQDFDDELKKMFPTASGSPAPTTSSQNTGPFSTVISSSGMHETKMGSVAIQVVTGDITKEMTDVIVNSSNEDFSLKSGVSKAILDAAGQAVEAECIMLGAQPNPGMIVTQPGNLKCKKILHLVGQTEPRKINQAVNSALQMCMKDPSYKSISFPAIGTGQGNVQARQVADAMLDAVVDVLSRNTSSNLKIIRIVIFQPPMLKDFCSSMNQKEATNPKDNKGSIWGNISSTLKSLFMGGSTDKSQKGDFVIEAQKVDPACFHICGDTQAKVNSAKQWINDLTSKEHNSNYIADNAILSFSSADHQHIVDIQKTMGVSIRIESKNDQASVTIEGLSNDVLKASNEIHKMLQKVKDEENLLKRAELYSTVADWQYQQQGQDFKSFDSMDNYELEQAMEKKKLHVNVTVQGQDYRVTMPNGPATDNQGNTLQIRRFDRLKAQQTESLPQHWDPMLPNSSCHTVTIHPGTAEHNEVLTLFQASCNRTVHKIERIQNPVLWKSLQIRKEDMEQKNGHQNNDRRLFHGTCYTTIAHINEHGFNRSYAGKNAACYGNGTYFAVNANYSAQDTYSKPNAQGQKFMYLCCVLTGDYTLGRSGMIVPPQKVSNSIQKYDSVVDNPVNPSMFVIFHDSNAYPEYLITFK